MPAAGVEPARPRGHKILSLARLPIPSRRLIDSQHRNFIKSQSYIQEQFISADSSPVPEPVSRVLLSLSDYGFVEGLLALLDLNTGFKLFLSDAVVDRSYLLAVNTHTALLDKTTAFASRRDE